MADSISDNTLIDLTGIPLDELTSEQHEATLFTALDNILNRNTVAAASGGFISII